MKSAQEIKILIDARLAALYESPPVLNVSDHPLFKELIDELQLLLARGGKRFRPYLAYVSYTLYGGKSENEIVTIGTALELIHGFLLIHDDIIDQDVVRHGGLNLTGRYTQKLRKRLPSEEARRAAESVALIGGDICHLLAQHLLLQAGLESKRALELSILVTESTLAAAVGELLDLALPLRQTKLLSVQVVLDMYAQKTASYSLVGPLQIGNLLAGGSAGEHKKLETFALPLGVAYQLQDDLLGIFGNEKEIGKSPLSDMRQNKQTPLYLTALQRATVPQKKILLDTYGNPAASMRDLKIIRKFFLETHSVEVIEKKITQLSEQSAEACEKLSLNASQKEILLGLSKMLLKRKY